MSKDTCTVDGCDKSVIARGFCHGHYKRFIRGKPVNVELREPRGDLEFVQGTRVTKRAYATLEREAKRRSLTVYMLASKILEAWAKRPGRID